MQKSLRHTVVIDFSHYVQRKLLFWWFKSGVFEPRFGAYSRRERRYPYIKGCNSGTSQKILWEQIVTCSEHSKEHFKTNLAEYWEGCTVGQVTSRTKMDQLRNYQYAPKHHIPIRVLCSVLGIPCTRVMFFQRRERTGFSLTGERDWNKHLF